jgi:FkbH-like protein
MSDSPNTPATFLASLGHGAPLPSLPGIFQGGDRIAEAMADPRSIPAGTPTQRIAVLGAVTTDFLVRAIACAVVREGVVPSVYQAPYGAFVQEILDPASALHGFAPELTVIAPHWRDMLEDLPIGTPAEAVDATLEPKVRLMQDLWKQLSARGSKILQHTLVIPPARFRGVAERLAPASPANQIARLNTLLLEAGHGLVTWIDIDGLASEIGSKRFAPAKFYYSAKLEHDQKWLPDYMPLFRAAWRAANARAKKVLVLDLDNTLWGGVIGDDGAEGIVLGPGTPAGEAFADWQRYVKALGERGVILAVCSKNDPAVAETGFTHPGSVLKRDDFAAFECSWNDKAGGMRRIAAALNVGTDSFVFCDDNPAECDLIQRELPEVAVVCMGTDPAAFVDLFDAGHWLDAGGYTQEDLGRSAAYAARAAALAEQNSAADIGGYLTGLGMRGILHVPPEAEIARVAQLELKTNQFNVTTRRYSEERIRAFIAREDAIVLSFHLTDKFGDHGLTSTLIAIQDGDTLRIDSWLMSCRIFSRSAEQFMLRGLIEMAARRGVARMTAEYLPTEKNGAVAGLFQRLGFTATADGLFERDLRLDGLETWIVAA